MSVENKGNLITQRAFVVRDGVKLRRIDLLAEVTHKKGSTAYQMTEPMGLYGSGTPSPAHVLCELIKALEAENDATAAHEMADYPRQYLRQLRTGKVEGDAIQKLNFLIKLIADANYQLEGRTFEALPLGELRGIGELVLSVGTTASELGMMIDALIEEAEKKFKGAPMPGERLRSIKAG